MDNMDGFVKLEKDEIVGSPFMDAIDFNAYSEDFATDITQTFGEKQVQDENALLPTVARYIGDKEFSIEEQKVESAKRKAVVGRRLSQLMLEDEKLVGDSDEMDEVKKTLRGLEEAMTATQNHTITDKNVDTLQEHYAGAIAACQAYCANKNPWFPTGKRRKARVQATLERLIKEAEALEIGRTIINEGGSEAEQINSGTRLLALAAMQHFIDQMKSNKVSYEDQMSRSSCMAIVADLNRQIEALKPNRDALQAEYEKAKQELDALKEQKGQGGLMGFFGSFFNSDPEIDAKQEEVDNKQFVFSQVDDQIRLLESQVQQNQTRRRALDSQIEERENQEQQQRNVQAMNAVDAREASLRKTDGLIKKLPKELQGIARMLNRGQMPSAKLNGKKVSDEDKHNAADMAKVRLALASLKPRVSDVVSVNLNGYLVRFVSDKYGNLNMQANGVNVPLFYKTNHALHMISADVVKNFDLYGEQAVNAVIRQIIGTPIENRGDLLRSREYCVAVITKLTGIPQNLFNNLSVQELQMRAQETLEAYRDKEHFAEYKADITEFVDRKNRQQKHDSINTVMNLELQRFEGQRFEGIQLNIEEKKEDGWNEEERMVRDFAADVIFSQESWMTDRTNDMPGKRLHTVLRSHTKVISLIIADEFRDKQKKPEGFLDGIIARLPLFALGEEEVQNFKNQLRETLDGIREFILEQVDQVEGVVMKNLAKAALVNPALVEGKVKDALNNMDADGLKQLAKYEKQINETVTENMNGVQEAFDSCLDALFDAEEEEVKQEVIPANLIPIKEHADTCRERVRVNAEKLKNLGQENAQNQAEITAIKAEIKRDKEVVENYAKQRRMEAIRVRMEKRKESIKMFEDRLAESEQKLKELEAKDPEDLDIAEGHMLHDLPLNIQGLRQGLKEAQDRTAQDLTDTIQDSVKGGKKGQSLFMKNVMRTYFKGMPVLDQRSMLAGAIRNLRPTPVLTEEEKKNLSDDQRLEYMADTIGGIFKGAGPLFQKMLQGLPIDSLPKGLRKAVEDTQDSLASIPSEIVKIQMDGIKERSNGKITRIEVNKSLGAASVGQAFLCKIYGPENKTGKDVVIKLLRPDVRNRMMREKEIMLEAARMTDEDGMLPYEIEEKRNSERKGGMESTYLGNLQRIEEELDLTIEARNCREGQVYDKPLYDEDKKEYKENLCDAMKLSNLAEATSDTCVMEIAGTKTVKRYMSDMRDRQEQLLWRFCEREKEKDSKGKETGREVLKRNKDGSYVLRGDLTGEERRELEAVRMEFEGMLQDMEKRQKALAQVTEKWVLEGIFKKGFYHGDLHAGNIMISEKGVSIIDFGNATKLTGQEQKHIIRMMVAATMGDAERFRHGFHMLLKNTPEEVYQEKRDELTIIFRDVMSTGTQRSAAERIAAALIRAQEIGLELPPTIANFSSCQLRLQNTLNDMNTNLKNMRNNVSLLRRVDTAGQQLREMDSIAKLQFDNRTRSAEDARKEIKNELDRRGHITEDEIIEQLNDNVNREKFQEKFNISLPFDTVKLQAEYQKISDWLSGKSAPTQEDYDTFDQTPTQDFSRLFPEFQKYTESDGISQDNANFLMLIQKKIKMQFLQRRNEPQMRNMVIAGDNILKEKPQSIEEMANIIKSQMPMYKDAVLEPVLTEKQKKLQAFYHAQDTPGVTADEFEDAMNAVVTIIKEEINSKQTYKEENKNRFMELVPPKLQTIPGQDPTRLLQLAGRNCLRIFKCIVNSCVHNKENGQELIRKRDEVEELMKACTQSMDAYNQNIDRLRQAMSETFEVLWEAQKNTLLEMYEKATDPIPISTVEPDGFLDIMGSVLADKKYSVIFTLDVTASVKMIYEMVKEKLSSGEE